MINDYDKFAKQRQQELLTGMLKPHRFVEKPMMRDMLPDLKGKRVLMLGCGTGEESLLLATVGAEEVVGIDLSETSIEIAKKSYPNCEFMAGDMHNLPFDDEAFDFIYSSLTVHYSDTPEKVFSEVYRILRNGGSFLFSVGHPIRWASSLVQTSDGASRITGHTVGAGDSQALEDGFTAREEEQIIYGHYLSFFKSEPTFKRENETLQFYVTAPSVYFRLLRKNGFSVDDFQESKCIEECRQVDIDYYNRYSELPQFMAFLAVK